MAYLLDTHTLLWHTQNSPLISADLAEWIDTTPKAHIQTLPIQKNHLLVLETLPLHHRDPFDRIIIAQSQAENMPIVSRDNAFDHYLLTRVWDNIPK